jgi:hypothetical protein
MSGLLGNELVTYLLIEELSQNSKQNSKKDSNSYRTGAKDPVTEGNVFQSLDFAFHAIGTDPLCITV